MNRRLTISPANPHAAKAAGAVQRAFTLIELMVVVAILIVLAGIALPAVKGLTRGNGRSQALVMARAWISAARGVAVSQHRMAGVVFFEETVAHARPANLGVTAIQLFVEDFDQQQYTTLHAGNTIFVPLNAERQYLPGGIGVAALNDDPAHGVMTGDEASSTVGKTRAILFDGHGEMVTRHGLARPASSGAPGTYPQAAVDWNFPAPSGANSIGISSPGIFLYDTNEYRQAAIPTGSSGNMQRNAWIKAHADVVLVNAITGGFIQ